MTANPRDSVSAFTEIGEYTLGDHIAGMLASVGWTVPVAALPTAIFFAASAFATVENILATFFASLIFAAIVAAFLATMGMLTIGLPATFALRATRLESVPTYTTIGTLAGAAAVTWLFEIDNFHEEGNVAFVALAALCGAVCACSWGRFRMEYRSYCTAEPHEPPTNPFHDMLH